MLHFQGHNLCSMLSVIINLHEQILIVAQIGFTYRLFLEKNYVQFAVCPCFFALKLLIWGFVLASQKCRIQSDQKNDQYILSNMIHSSLFYEEIYFNTIIQIE